MRRAEGDVGIDVIVCEAVKLQKGPWSRVAWGGIGLRVYTTIPCGRCYSFEGTCRYLCI